MRILFGVMTANEPPRTINQLLQALGSDHQIVLHHDHRKRGPIKVTQRNVHLVAEPEDTGWGTWGFCEAVLKTIATGLKLGGFDYFQLLSGSCLPIKPIAAFESHLASQSAQINADLTELVPGTPAWYCHGARLYQPSSTFAGRVLVKAGTLYGRSGQFVEMNGEPPNPGAQQQAAMSTGRRLQGTLGTRLFQMASSRRVKHTPYHDGVRPIVASTWFGCSAEVARFLVENDRQGTLECHMRNLNMVDETYFGTRLGNSSFALGPSNHLISPFLGTPHPVPLTPADLPELAASRAFFARKFPLQFDAQVRLQVLNRIEAQVECTRQPISEHESHS